MPPGSGQVGPIFPQNNQNDATRRLTVRILIIAVLLAIPAGLWLARGSGPSAQTTHLLVLLFRGLIIVAVGVEIARIVSRRKR